LITEDSLHIEPKGVNPFTVPNRLHVMLASNHKWVVPAGEHERRYQVSRVAETHRQDSDWFKPINQEMRNGGLAAMLHDLLDRNLGDWHPREIVRTEALAKQQEESLSPCDQWWLELLQTAILAGADDKAPNEAASNGWNEEIPEIGLYGNRIRSVRHDGLYDQARRISPKLKGVSETALGTYLGEDERGCVNTWVQRGGRSRRGWIFPPLGECRRRWMERFPATIWRDPETTEWTLGG
jgi:hypothetical protein